MVLKIFLGIIRFFVDIKNHIANIPVFLSEERQIFVWLCVTVQLRHYPGKTAAWMLEATIETAGTQGALWLRSLIPINQIYTLVALLIYSAISVEAVLWLLPLLTFYISFAVLIVVTAQMLQARRRLGDVRTIASMLSRFATFDEHTAASMYMWNSMKPYATFFLTLPICIASLTVADSGWLLCPEFGVLSIATSFICFLALSNHYDIFALASITIDFTSIMVPSVIESLPQIPIIYSIIWYLFGPGYAVELPVHGLCVRLGLPSLAFLVISLIFVKMAARKSWQGTYQVLVPHLVCFFWWRLSVAFFTRSTWFGLARALVGWVGLIFVLPLVPFLVIGYGIYLFRSVTSFSSLLKVLTTVLLVIGASVYAWWSRKGFRIGSWFSLYGKSPLSRAGMILVIVIASCVPLAYVFQPPPRVAVDDSSVGVLSWESYHRYCLSPESSMISCSKFTGARITASGVVTQWSVTLVENPAEAFAAWLPYPFSNWLRCAYGDSYPEDCSTIAEPEDFEACTLNKQLGRPCHLRDLDRFTYRLTIGVPGSGSVTIVAVNWFRDIANLIQPESEVTFGAVLSSDKWGSGVELRLESIQCVDQSCEIDEEADSGRWRSVVLLGRAVHSVWNFFLAPLIVFTP